MGKIININNTHGEELNPAPEFIKVNLGCF